MSSLERFCKRKDNSWVNHLDVDPEWENYKPNKTSREVKSGHYVFVDPTPLPDPVLIALSNELLEELELDEKECESDDRFLRYFSGDSTGFSDFDFTETWATPYALSIYGTDYIQNCPFGTGNGYGDGRAVSVGEIVLPNGKRWEFQLKGGGQTPFCRGADGRAVLRSSVREFLVSEAMYHLGVSTTRALSLIVSGSETVKRPWYQKSGENEEKYNEMLGRLPEAYRQILIQRMRDANVLVDNQTAITCRVSPSFTRVGHIQLFERRAREDSSRVGELEKLVKHTLFREYPEIDKEDIPFQDKVLLMLEEASARISKLTADWIRVGFCQGNFNSDNCLVAGRTMDYGPFGFIEKFTPLWNMWIGGGDHFGFLNQPDAGHKNFTSLAKAMEPLLDKNGIKEARNIAEKHAISAQRALQICWKKKLGISFWNSSVAELLNTGFGILQLASIDYTMFWRQLACLPILMKGDLSDEQLLLAMGEIYYEPLSPCNRDKIVKWLRDWMKLVNEEMEKSEKSLQDISTAMKNASPKYIPREWILVECYSAAIEGDYSLIDELYQLFKNPYDEQSPEMEAKYYKKAPAEVYEGAGLGGTAFMSCSS